MDGRWRRVWFVFSGLLVSASPLCAQGKGLRTVDQLSCAEAQAEVARTGRYYVSTPDGPIPVSFIVPLAKLSSCAMHEHLQYIRVRTRDTVSCHVGYTCGLN